MKGATLAPPPKLEGIELKTLGDTIRDRLATIEEGRRDRNVMISNIRLLHVDDARHREEPESIYKQSNVIVPLMKGIATSYASKVEDELLSSDTPFQARPTASAEKTVAEKHENYWLFEIMKEMRWGVGGSDTIAVVTSEGTAIKKRSWRVDKSYYPRVREVLHDANGPVEGPNGELIAKDHPVKMVPDPATGTDKPVLDFGQVGIELTPDHAWKELQDKAEVTHYDNATSQLIPFEDFVCDLKVADITLSPLVGHSYSMPVYALAEKVQNSSGGDINNAEAVAAAGWVMSNLLKVPSLPDKQSDTKGNAAPQTASLDAPRQELGEVLTPLKGVLTQQNNYKTCQLVECYLKYDIDGDGMMEDIVAIYERQLGEVMYANYLVNLYEDCKLPFVVHGFIRVPGRWYSMGPYEYLKCAQEFVDKVFNRMNYRQSMAANPMGWYIPENFVKGPEKWGPGEHVILRPDKRISESIGFIEMPALESIEWQHFQFFISLIQVVTGISNAAQGDISSLPSTQTATGITSIIQEGNKLYRMFIRRLQETMEQELLGIIKLIQQNLDRDRMFQYNHSDQTVDALITPDEIRELEFHVKVVVSKTGTQQKAQAIQAALQLVQTWMATPPQYQARLRDLFIQLLTILGLTEAESLLPSIQELEADQSNDAALQEQAAKVQEAIQKLAGAQLDPSTQIQQDLAGVVETLMKIAAQPPPGSAPIPGTTPPSAVPPSHAGAPEGKILPMNLIMPGARPGLPGQGNAEEKRLSL